MDYIKALEKALGKKAKIKFLPLQLGDVPDTFADVKKIKNELFFEPTTSVIDGITKLLKKRILELEKSNSISIRCKDQLENKVFFIKNNNT